MKQIEWSVWLKVISLAFAAFVFNTSEFVPVGLMTDIGQSFDMSSASIGLMITIYAWVVAVMSLPCMLMTGKMERRKLLLWVFAVFVVSHALSAVAWSYPILLLSRIGVALAHAVFWSITASIAVRVAPADKKSVALSFITLGTALATILGIPLGRVISEHVGWRMTFMVIGLVAFAIMIIVARCLPVLESKNTGSLKSVPQLFKRPVLTGIYLVVAIMVTAHFTAYSYIEPFITKIGHFDSQFATTVLFAFGSAGLLGSVIFSRYGQRHPKTLLNVALLLMMGCMALLHPASNSQVMLILVAMCWGTAITLMALSMQMQVLEQAHDATDVGMAMFSGIFNIGIGGGALLGSQVITGFGLQYVGEVGASVAFVGFIACTLLVTGTVFRSRPTSQS